jgi:hypothetical protein
MLVGCRRVVALLRAGVGVLAHAARAGCVCACLCIGWGCAGGVGEEGCGCVVALSRAGMGALAVQGALTRA